MTIGFSDGSTYEDALQYMAYKDAPKVPPGGSTEPAGASKSDDPTRTPAGLKKVIIGPDIKDERDQSLTEAAMGYLSDSWNTPKLGAFLQHPWAPIPQTLTANAPAEHSTLGDALGLKDLGTQQEIQSPVDRWNKMMAPDPDRVWGHLNGKPITDEDIDQAIHIGMSAGPGILAGVNSATAPLSDASRWFVGGEGKLRYEIPDEGMKFVDRDWKFGDKGKLPEFIDHPELFKAYPQLKDINFEVADPKTYGPYLGGFNSAENKLTINPDFPSLKGNDERLLDVVSHELQHAVQGIEGFNLGSNPGKALKEAVYALKDKMLATSDPEHKKDMFRLMLDIGNNAEKFAKYMYQRVPGEVEANLVMNRRKLSSEQREMFTPQETQQMLEGHPNLTSGGKYYPEFRYPETK